MESHLARLQQELEEVIARMTESALGQAPAGKWNSAQIFEHLYLTYTLTNRGLAKALEKGAPLATRATMKSRLYAFSVLWLSRMPVGFEAPSRVVPRGMSFAEVKSRLSPEIQAMEAGFQDCERRWGAATKLLDNPNLGPLTSDEWRKFHLVHGRHHIRQIRERAGI